MMRTRQWLFNAFTAAILVGLAACGGGGDGGPAPVTGPTIDITAGNRDTVAHATVAGLWALSPTNFVPLSVGPSASGRLMSAWLRPLSKQVAGALAQREHPQAVIGPVVEPCQISGSVSLTLDDRNGDGLPSAVGEVLTVTFNNCQDYVGETTTNGTMTMTFTALNQTSGSARVAMTNLSYDWTNHAMTLNGQMLVDYTPGTIETARATVESPVTIAVSIKHLTPVFSDTVTLQTGFVAQETHDNSLGHSVNTFSGLAQSAAAGGTVQVNTVNNGEIKAYDDAYPYAGTVQVRGKNTTLMMTVQPSGLMRLDHDVNGDGAFESTELKDWDWLL